MIITRYKPLFSVSTSYELAATGVSSEGMVITGMQESDDSMQNFKLKPQYKKNIATVFFEGTETPADAPVTCEPTLVIDTEEYFYFGISFSDKEKIKGLKFHSTDDIAKSI